MRDSRRWYIQQCLCRPILRYLIHTVKINKICMYMFDGYPSNQGSSAGRIHKWRATGFWHHRISATWPFKAIQERWPGRRQTFRELYSTYLGGGGGRKTRPIAKGNHKAYSKNRRKTGAMALSLKIRDSVDTYPSCLFDTKVFRQTQTFSRLWRFLLATFSNFNSSIIFILSCHIMAFFFNT